MPPEAFRPTRRLLAEARDLRRTAAIWGRFIRAEGLTPLDVPGLPLPGLRMSRRRRFLQDAWDRAFFRALLGYHDGESS